MLLLPAVEKERKSRMTMNKMRGRWEECVLVLVRADVRSDDSSSLGFSELTAHLLTINVISGSIHVFSVQCIILLKQDW
jgi:hypothetical protein